MGRRQRSRARAERGSVALEFGLLAPILLLLVFGIADFGWMMNRDMVVDNASRDAVRIASLGGDYSTTCEAAKAELSSSGITPPTLCNGSATNGSPVKITLDTLNSSGGAAGTNVATSYNAAALSGTTVYVTITYDYKWVTPMMSGIFGSTRTMTESTRMVVE
jgi:Flp pilus assembly protein TadG